MSSLSWGVCALEEEGASSCVGSALQNASQTRAEDGSNSDKWHHYSSRGNKGVSRTEIISLKQIPE